MVYTWRENMGFIFSFDVMNKLWHQKSSLDVKLRTLFWRYNEFTTLKIEIMTSDTKINSKFDVSKKTY